jgi:hypothetical protein
MASPVVEVMKRFAKRLPFQYSVCVNVQAHDLLLLFVVKGRCFRIVGAEGDGARRRHRIFREIFLSFRVEGGARSARNALRWKAGKFSAQNP